MKIKWRESHPAERLRWHTWFAWYPVRIDPEQLAWLETVDRRGNLEYNYEGGSYWTYEYKEHVKTTTTQ